MTGRGARGLGGPAVRRVAALLGAAALVALLPEASLDCRRPLWESRAPDGAEILTACARPMLFAMPGGGSDGDGWIVLRDGRGRIRGAVDVSLIYSVPSNVRWSAAAVAVPMHAGLPRAGVRSGATAFAIDRWWRLRALLGLVPTDAEFR